MSAAFMAKPSNPIRRALTRFFALVVRTYFREVEVIGEAPGKDVKGRLFAANHVNGLVDPILVVTTAECPISPVAKSTLWNIPGFRLLLDLADAVPIVRKRDNPGKSAKDNDAVFERVANHLKGGGNILIFPEGTSHNEPALVPFRSGAGRMLARARTEGGEGLEVQPVGLEFDERQIFRSRVLVVYGKPIKIDDFNEPDDDALANAITARLREDLTALVVEGATWDERLLVTRVAELLSNEGDDSSLAGWSAIGRQAEAARKLLSDDDPVLLAVRETVSRYYDALTEAKTADIGVKSRRNLAPRSVLGLLGLLAILPLSLAGAALFWLPYRLPRLVVRATKQESSDLTSTYKLAAGLLAFPLWAILLVALVAWKLPVDTAPKVLACLGVLASPFAALVWLDRLPRLSDTFGLLIGRGRGRLEHLRALRKGALDAIERGREKTFGALPP